MPAVQWLWSAEPSTPRSWTSLRGKPARNIAEHGTSRDDGGLSPAPPPSAATRTGPGSGAATAAGPMLAPSGVVIALRAGGGRDQQAGRPAASGSRSSAWTCTRAKRLIEFRRHAARRRKARDLGKPETFDFLNFTHICGKTRDGRLRAVAGQDLQADAGQAARAQARAHAAPPSARPRAGQMAGKRDARALRLLCRAWQQQGGRQHAHHHRHLRPPPTQMQRCRHTESAGRPTAPPRHCQAYKFGVQIRRVCSATIVLARLRSVTAMSGVSVQAEPSVLLMAIPGARFRSYSRCRPAFPRSLGSGPESAAGDRRSPGRPFRRRRGMVIDPGRWNWPYIRGGLVSAGPVRVMMFLVALPRPGAWP